MKNKNGLAGIAMMVIAPLAGNLQGQEAHFSQSYEVQASLSNAQTPLWLNANKYGVSSLKAQNGYGRATLEYSRGLWENRLQWNTGVDVIVPIQYQTKGYSSPSQSGYNSEDYTSRIILQQCYTELRWKALGLSIGAKQRPAELRNNLLSAGAQTLGINARPIPQVRLGCEEWWNIPGLKQWVALKAHVAYGMMTDGTWQEDFVGNSGAKYNKQVRYHEKAGYLHIGKEERFPLSMTLGLEMAAQFGGELYNYFGTDQNGYQSAQKLELKSDLKSYWNAFLPGGGDTNETEFQNAEGNQVGSWIIRLDWNRPKYAIGLYWDHYFEDHSSMLLIDYDGYGEGSEWKEKQELKFFAYYPQDAQWGIDLTLKEGKYLKGAVIEFLNSRYQSGPVYHDRNSGNNDHIGGVDDYYNHSTLPGWQHWGQTLGNPLYKSPQYNKDGILRFEDNRICAWHGGINGSILDNLDYRMLLSWQKSLGTYMWPNIHPKENTSLLWEMTWHGAGVGEWHGIDLNPIDIRLAYGADWGHLLGNHSGWQLTIKYQL